MKTLKILVVSTMLLSVMSCFAAPVSERQPSITSAAAAFSALHDSGYVVVIRHSKTARDQSDTNPFNLDKCGDQRRLTDTGIVTAIGIGKQFSRSQVAFD